MVYVGVDLHRKSSHVAVLADDVELLASRRVPSAPEEFLRVFGELGPAPVEVAFEATYGWGWFADLLSDAGIPAHMAHPLATKAISSARVKNDEVDARTLAHLLRTNLLPEAWAAPPEVRDARKLARTRISLVRISSRLKCQTHALLADQGIAPPITDVFGLAGRAFVGELRLRPIPQVRLQANLRLIDLLSPRGHRGRRRAAAALPSRPPHRKARSHPRDRLHDRGRRRGRGVGQSPGSPRPSTCAPGPGSPPPSAPAPSTPGGATSPSRDRGGCGGRWWSRPAAPT